MIDVRRYVTASGKDVIGDWMAGLNDDRARAKIIARIDRLEAGNFGDWKSLEGGLCELRIDYGPGYRVYFARISNAVVLLLCGGDKRRQTADLRRAIMLLRDYEARRL